VRLYDGNTSYNTFTLLWCEMCGKAASPPMMPRLPDFVADTILTCDCGEPLALLEAVISPNAVHHQERLGMPHLWVASLLGLEKR
jgi:hypothetical protein